MIINGIDFTGICTEFPNDFKYFNQEFFTDTVSIDVDKPDIKEIISVNASINGKIVEALKTPIRTSNEGNRLLGKKMLIELDINYKIKYLSNNVTQRYIYILNKTLVKSAYLIFPNEIEGKGIDEIHRKDGIIIKPYIEYVYAKTKNNREIITNISFIINGKVRMGLLGCLNRGY